MYMAIEEYPTPKDGTYASVYAHEAGRDPEWFDNFADARAAAEWLESNGFSKAYPEQEGDWSDPVNRMMMGEYCVAVYEKEDETEGYAGPGFYEIRWSDGGEANGAEWVEDADGYAAMLTNAHRAESEFHLPYAEYLGRDVFQMHELEAFLGEPEDFDVEAIVEEATFIDYATGDRIWRADIDLNEICERNAR